MSLLWARGLIILALVAAGLLQTLGPAQPGARAQQPDAANFASNPGIDFAELIASSVMVRACDDFRVADGPIDLATFDRNGTSCWRGSGTVIDPSGIILTNAHVALNSTQDAPVWALVLRTIDSRSLPQPAFFARSVLHSPAWGPRRAFGEARIDLAVMVPALTLDGAPIQPGEVTMRPLPMAMAASVEVGDPLFVIGYPEIGGELISITRGAVSGFEPDEFVRQLGNVGWIKTDAILGGGVSGGTTVDATGLMIGVPTRMGESDDRPVCADEEGNPVWCSTGLFNRLRPIPEGYTLLTDVGLGEGLPAPTVAEPETTTTDDPAATNPEGVTVTGSIVSADSGQPVPGAWFIVLEPGVPVDDYLNGRQEVVYTFATSGADGGFQLKKPVARGQAYGVVVIARDYLNFRQDGQVLAAADAPPVVTLEPIRMAVQR